MYCTNLLRQLLKDDTTKDFSISAKDGNSVKVHKPILFAKCPKVLEDAEALESGSIATSVQNIRSVELVVEFLYTGTCSLDHCSVVDIMCVGYELGFNELVQATSGIITNELKLLNPNTAFIILDQLTLRIEAGKAVPTPTPVIAGEVELCERLRDAVVSYIANNGYDVLMQTISYITVKNAHFTAQTLRAVLVHPYLSCSETQVLSLIDAWTESESSHETEETIKELYGMVDLDQVPSKTLMSYKGNKYIPKTRYVEALECHTNPAKSGSTFRHRDHGRFGIGHSSQTYHGYRLVESIDEFLLLFPELLRQYDYEGSGIPLLGNFTVSRSSLGIKGGLVAVGWDPRPILVKSEGLDFKKVGEHKGRFAELMIRGYSSLKDVPTTRNSWAVNPTLFGSGRASEKDKNDRPGLFVRCPKPAEPKKEKKEKEEEGKIVEKRVEKEKVEKEEEVKEKIEEEKVEEETVTKKEEEEKVEEEQVMKEEEEEKKEEEEKVMTEEDEKEEI